MRRGHAAMREAKASQSSGGSGGLRFVLKDGESAIVRIYGDFENEQDPVIYDTHYVKRLSSKPYHNCAHDLAAEGKHAGCVFCWAKDNGDKGISRSPRALFHVRDTRKQHKFETKVRFLKPGRVVKPGVALPPEAYDESQYPPCRGGKMCQFCNQGNQAQENGHRKWELALQYAEQLISQQASLRTYCLCGARAEDGSGTIYTNQYLCSNCSNPVEYYPDSGATVARCSSCKQTMPPLEEIACTACTDAHRCDIKDFFFRVSRTGSMQDTSYNFEAIHPCKPPTAEELQEAEEKKPNFEEACRPEPAELQARHLGIQVPFATSGHGSQTYDTPTEAPARPQMGGAKPVGTPVAGRGATPPKAAPRTAPTATPATFLPTAARARVKIRLPSVEQKPSEDDDGVMY